MSLSSEFVSDQDESSGLEIPMIILPPRITVIFRTGEPFYAEFCVNAVVSNSAELEVEGPCDDIVYPPGSTRRPMDVTKALVRWLSALPGVECVRIERQRIGIAISPAVEWDEISDIILEGISDLVYGLGLDEVDVVTIIRSRDSDEVKEVTELPHSSDLPDDQPPPAVC